MKEIRTKRELLAQCSFEEGVGNWKKSGARLTPQEVSLLGDALWQGYRRSVQHEPRAMSDAERNVKKSVVDGAASSLADLEVVIGLLRGRLMATPAWFSIKDIRRALPAQRVAQLVSELAWIAGQDYADAILGALRFYYSNHGESVVVIREPK